MPGRLVIGTSSWADVGFVREWYPHGLPSKDRLPYYARYFNGVEVNSTFYNVPARAAVAKWAQLTPAGFTFDVKLHRALSRHVAYRSSLPKEVQPWARSDDHGRLVLTDELERALIDVFIGALEPLRIAGKLSSLLLQLAPTFSPERHSLAELDRLIERIAPTPLAIELRHRGWVQGERARQTLAFLAERDVAFVCVDSPPGEHATIMPSNVSAVTCKRLAYLRAHGRNTDGYLHGRTVAERFAYRYADSELRQILERASQLNRLLDHGHTRVMLNNNRGRDAPDAAERMLQLLQDGRADAAGQLSVPGEASGGAAA